MLTSKNIVEGYLKKSDWRVQENSNAPYSFGALNKHITTEVSKDYWLRHVYTPEIVEAHREGFFHMHDLGGLTVYCCGYSLRQILLKGVKGIPSVPRSKPAKHFDAALNQLANLTTIFQNEIMGAVAFSSFDTLLAPYVKADKLSYEQVFQHMQNFIFSINSNSRAGAEPAFSNITMDLTPPNDLRGRFACIGGKTVDFKYGDCQKEMDLINKAFYEVMIEGDAVGAPFAYPIPTYNIHERFDWDNPNNDLLWEMAGKYGSPYFANFIGSDMDPSDARSMCCRLRLDKRELLRRNGGLFGSGDSTGSIGVVTLNLPKLGFLADGNVNTFYELLEEYMDLAYESLEIKRKYLTEEILNKGLLPAFMEYVGTFDNHFSTIGYIGMNELCMNLFGRDIEDVACRDFCINLLDFMLEKLKEYQEKSGNLYNLEASPAESTCFSLALKDKKALNGIYQQGTKEAPYYTNSCHLPVRNLDSVKKVMDHQEPLQVKHTGGTVIHLYLAGPIQAEQAKTIVKTVCTNYKVPYISLSPVNCYCPEHGHMDEVIPNCPICGTKTNVYQRITGYQRIVENFNPGKKAEFFDRAQIQVDKEFPVDKA